MTSSPLPDSAGLRRLQRALEAGGQFFATQRHLIAVRDGVVGALPLVLTGSLFLLVSQSVRFWGGEALPELLVPYRVLGGMISLYVTFAAAHSLARSYALDPLAAGLLAVAAYLLAAFQVSAPPAVGLPPAPPSLALARLGAGGIFAGLLLALGTVEVMRLLVQRRWTIRLPPTAPEAIVRSFVALTPAMVVVTATFAVVHLLRVDVIGLLEQAARPLLVATGSLPAALAVVGIDSGLWLLGVHASAALATMRPLWEAMLVENMEAAASGSAVLPHIASLPFYQWFVWQGGSGTTLALALHLWGARSAQLRSVGRLSLLPALCNVNEPILFGAPVILNPLLAVPFALVPLLCAVTSYAAMAAGLVTRPYLEMPWILPAPVGAFLSTGGDWRAVALQLGNLALGFLLYWPFVRRYDAKLQRLEAPAASAPRDG